MTSSQSAWNTLNGFGRGPSTISSAEQGASGLNPAFSYGGGSFPSGGIASDRADWLAREGILGNPLRSQQSGDGSSGGGLLDWLAQLFGFPSWSDFAKSAAFIALAVIVGAIILAKIL